MAIKIDKNVLTDEERATFEALLAKASVDPEAAQGKTGDEEPPKANPKKAEGDDTVETKKSAPATPAAPAAPVTPEIPEFFKNAIAKSEEFMARIEKKEMADVAKKYSVLGQKPEELAEQLYNLKKSDETMYNTCIAMLDSQVEMLEKSGLFQVIGKSATDSPAGGAEAMAEAKAREIMKSDSSMDYTTAIAKAYEDPDIMAAYDAEYHN